MDIGKTIKNYRLALGLTQAELSKPNLNRSVISQIESGKIDPSLKTLKQIAANLGVKMSDLIRDEEDMVEGQVLLINRAKNYILKNNFTEAKETLRLVSLEELSSEYKGMYYKIYGILYYSTQEYELAIKKLDEALEYITPTNINDYMEVYAYLVFSQRYVGKYIDSINGSIYGVTLLEKFNISDHNILLYIKFIYNLAVCYCRINQFEDGLVMIRKVHEISSEHGLNLYEGSLNMLEGVAHLYLGNFQESIVASAKAHEYFRGKGNYTQVVACLTNIAICYRKQKYFNKSIECLEKAISLCDEYKLVEYKKNANFERILNFAQQKEYSLVFTYMEQNQEEDDFLNAKLYYVLAKIYFEKQNIAKALNELEAAIKFFERTNDYWLSECYLLKGSILVNQGDIPEALSYFEKGHQILLKKTGEFIL